MSEPGCRRCGDCCRQGGPALHGPDLALIRSGALALDDLVTVRRGELAIAPLAAGPKPVHHEFLKMRGRDGSWCCAFYDDKAKGCLRYDRRPMACGLLDCADTGPLLALVGRDLLTRFECLVVDDPLLPLMRSHEQRCPCPDLHTVAQHLQQAEARPRLIAELERALAADLAFREQVQSNLGLTVHRELFAFGRPLFHLLLPLGLQPVPAPTGLRLRYLPADRTSFPRSPH